MLILPHAGPDWLSRMCCHMQFGIPWILHPYHYLVHESLEVKLQEFKQWQRLSCTYNFAVVLQTILNLLIIDHSTTMEHNTMLLNGMMLKSLDELQTFHQIAKILLLKDTKFVSDSSKRYLFCTCIHGLQIPQSKHVKPTWFDAAVSNPGRWGVNRA